MFILLRTILHDEKSNRNVPFQSQRSSRIIYWSTSCSTSFYILYSRGRRNICIRQSREIYIKAARGVKGSIPWWRKITVKRVRRENKNTKLKAIPTAERRALSHQTRNALCGANFLTNRRRVHFPSRACRRYY